MNIHKYYYDEYYDDISDFVDNYRLVKNPHIVGVYSDGLPAAVHISNALKCPLSIYEQIQKHLYNTHHRNTYVYS